MSSKRIKFTFPKNLIKEPLIYQLGHKFKVVTNVRRADVRENAGWVLLELEGEENEISNTFSRAENETIAFNSIYVRSNYPKLKITIGNLTNALVPKLFED